MITKQRLEEIEARARRLAIISTALSGKVLDHSVAPPSGALEVTASLREAWRLADEHLKKHHGFVELPNQWCDTCRLARAILPTDWSSDGVGNECDSQKKA